MNKIKIALIGIAALGLAMVSNAQTASTNAPANFFQNLGSWASSRTASGLTWPVSDFDAATGGRYVNNLQWANYVSVTKNLGSFYAGAELDTAGVVGTIEAASLRVGYTVSNVGDLRVKGGIDVGYNRLTSSIVGQPELIAEKLITATTYAEIKIGYPISAKGVSADYPDIAIGAGGTF